MKITLRFRTCMFLSLSFLAVSANPSWTEQRKPLANSNVIELVKAGHSESFIRTMIAESPTAFSLGPEDQIELENAGVPESIIKAMIEASAQDLPGDPVQTDEQAEAERRLIEEYEEEAQPNPSAATTQTDEEAEAERRLIEEYERAQPEDTAAQTEDEAEAERRKIEEYEAQRAPTAEESPPAEKEIDSVPPPVVEQDLQFQPVAESYTRGLEIYRNRRYQEALDEFIKVAAAEPDRADVHYLIGYCHLMLRDYDQSLEAFRLSFERDPAFDPRIIYQELPSP